MKGHILFLGLFLVFGLTSFSQENNNSYEKILHERTKQLKLDEISNGYDSIQIRIWPRFYCGCKAINFPDLIVLKNYNNEWYGESYYVNSEVNYYQVVREYETRYFNPTSSWIEFLNEINIKEIIELEAISDSVYVNTVIADGYVDLIEIATKESYKFIVFKQTRLYIEKYDQARIFCNLNDILVNNVSKK